MLARTPLVLAKSGRSAFARFYSDVLPSMGRVKGTNRMKVAGALWTITTPKFQAQNTPARLQAALRLYEKEGSKVTVRARAIRAARAQARRRNKGRPAKVRAAAMPKRPRKARRRVGARTRSATHRRPATKRRARRAKPRPLASLVSYRKAVTAAKLSPAQSAVLAATFRATAGMAEGERVSAGRKVLSILRRGPTPTRAARSVKTVRRTPRHHRRSAAQTHRRRAPRSARSSKKAGRTRRVRGSLKTVKRAGSRSSAVTPYQSFRKQVLARTGLRPGAGTNVRVQRLWFLVSSQANLSAKGRVDMAVGLIRKSGAKKHGRVRHVKVARTAKTRGAIRTRASTSASTTKTKAPSALAVAKARKKAAAQRRRNQYLRFFRAMVLTGEVPNHPKGARSRKIKQLWGHTKHLRSINARIKLGTSYATGAVPMPRPAKKVSPGKAKRTVKAAAKAAKQQGPVALRLVLLKAPPMKKTAPKTAHKAAPKAAPRAPVARAPPAKDPVRFTVPEVYRKDPFTGGYVALHKFTGGANPSAKMQNFSRAWARSAMPPGVPDTRTPHQRIKAAAEALRST